MAKDNIKSTFFVFSILKKIAGLFSITNKIPNDVINLLTKTYQKVDEYWEETATQIKCPNYSCVTKYIELTSTPHPTLCYPRYFHCSCHSIVEEDKGEPYRHDKCDSCHLKFCGNCLYDFDISRDYPSDCEDISDSYDTDYYCKSCCINKDLVF